MKVKLLFVLFYVISILCSAQQSEKTSKIEKYINTLKKYQNSGEYTNLKYLDDKHFKAIVKEYYEATETAPTELKQIFENDHQRWMEDVKRDRNNLKKNVKLRKMLNMELLKELF